MRRLSHDDLAGAWRDLIACHRLGRLTARGGTIVEGLVGIALDGMAHDADLHYAASPRLSSENLKQRLGELKQLPAWLPLADKVDLCSRLTFLETLTRLRRDGLDAIQALGLAELSDSERARWQRAIKDADWDGSLREANRWYDRLVAAMRDENRMVGLRTVQIIEQEPQLHNRGPVEFDEFVQDRLYGPEPIDLLLPVLFPGLFQGIVAESQAAQRQSQLECAFALEAFRRDRGAFPNRLAEIAPQYLPAEPTDLYSGGPLVYQLRADGCLLYSIGPNGQDDGGLPRGTNNVADDLPLRMPPEEPK